MLTSSKGKYFYLDTLDLLLELSIVSGVFLIPLIPRIANKDSEDIAQLVKHQIRNYYLNFSELVKVCPLKSKLNLNIKERPYVSCLLLIANQVFHSIHSNSFLFYFFA